MTRLAEADGVEICSLCEAMNEGVVDIIGIEITLLLDIVLIVDIPDGSMIVVDDEYIWSLLDISMVGVTEDAEICTVFDAAMVEFTENKEINILLDVTLVNVTDGVNVCPLLDATLVIITDAVEVS